MVTDWSTAAHRSYNTWHRYWTAHPFCKTEWKSSDISVFQGDINGKGSVENTATSPPSVQRAVWITGTCPQEGVGARWPNQQHNLQWHQVTGKLGRNLWKETVTPNERVGVCVCECSRTLKLLNGRYISFNSNVHIIFDIIWTLRSSSCV